MKRITLETLYRWQFPFYMLATLGLAFFRQISNNDIMPLLLVFWLIYGYYAFSHSSKSTFKTIFTIFLLYATLSALNYSFNGLPFTFYYNDLRALIIPMLAVYVGMINDDEDIYKWFVFSTVFCILVGLYLYFVQPSWYLSFKVSAVADTLRYSGSNLSEENVMFLSDTGRFSSFFPSTYPLAYFTTFSICVTLCDMYKGPENRMFKSNVILLFVLGVLLVGIILTLTRVALLYIIILIFYYSIYGNVKKKVNQNIMSGLIIIIVAAVAFTIIKISESEYGGAVFERMTDRLTLDATNELTEGSRGNQVKVALAAWSNYLTGDGMGARGGAARAKQMPGITDNDWIRVLVEFGVVGVILIIAIFGMSIKRAIIKRKYYMAELTIVLYGVFSMLVADTLYKGPLVLIFWFAIGRIWNQRLFFNRVNNKNYI